MHRGLRVPMRDGVDLITDHYVPAIDDAKGTLLVRCPYGRGWPISGLLGAVYASRGYHVLVQSVRGTFGSGGDFTPMINEAADGADTVAWLRGQPWFTGSFATVGQSYLGFTQWALLTDPPPEMKAAVIIVGPHDLSDTFWGTGSYSLNDSLGWSDLVAHQEDPGRLRAAVRQLRARRVVARAANELPLGEAGRALLGAGAPWYDAWLEHSDPSDVFWAGYDASEALDRGAGPGAADQRLAGPVSGTDADSVPAPAPPRSPSRVDRRTLDPHAHDDQGRPDRDPRIAGLARHPSGRQRQAGAQPGTGLHQRPRLDRAGRLATHDARARAAPAAGEAGSPTPSRPRRRRRRCSPTTRPTRRPPSAVDCCHRTVATATTPGSPSVPTCSASPATRSRRTCTWSAPR